MQVHEADNRRWRACVFVGVLLLFATWGQSRADVVEQLPRYDLTIHLDTHQHIARVRQLVTWTNCSHHPASELVFNAHAHYQVPGGDVGLLAKTLEILR